MNPETARRELFETPWEFDARMARLAAAQAVERARWGTATQSELVRSDGTPVPLHWTNFAVGELVLVRGHTFRVAYLNGSSLTLEPMPLELPSLEAEP